MKITRERSLEPLYAEWKQRAKAYIKGTLRRKAAALLPNREAREYQRWIEKRRAFRKDIYPLTPQKGLLSILTPVWNGSPVRYLRELAESISQQNKDGACEWVLLDNGCSDEKLLACLKELSAASWVKLDRAKANLGITRGLRRCLEQAKGRYVMAVDADDLLYPDALQVVASVIVNNGYPPLLYTDEDKVNGSRRYQPYFKPDWDPVLLLNSAYIAHLGVIERRRALKLGAYSDAAAEGSQDWDLFVRFLIAGQKAIHIPEVVYSWRVHATSTADDVARKPYIGAAQRSVLRRFLDAEPCGRLFEIEPSPLFAGGDHWHFRRKQEQPKAILTIVLTRGHSATLQQYADPVRAVAREDGLVCFIGEDVTIEDPNWIWEVTGILDLHRDTIMVGGRLRRNDGKIIEAGLEFGFDGICGSPNRGKPASDPGYFGQTWKQRSVSAVSTRFAAMKARFLVELLEQLPKEATLGFLGVWAGAYALKTGRRVVYSPFLSGISDIAREQPVGDEEKQLFRDRYGDLQDGRFYSRFFSRTKPFELWQPETMES
jgi:glycosyltransferase involved in cell wall biosynthesis